VRPSAILRIASWQSFTNIPGQRIGPIFKNHKTHGESPSSSTLRQKLEITSESAHVRTSTLVNYNLLKF
jgi:hypothetical protein